MLLVIGLGNPGERYARTRHNVAWQVLEELAARHHAGRPAESATGREWNVSIAGREVQLLKPLTFMNGSGEALADWRGRHGLEEGLLLVSDDVYLPLGTLRLRARGSSGGHRGLESIEAALGSREFERLRIGVGAAESSAALREHVLEEFAPEDAPALDAAIRRAADALECWVSEGALGAMNQFNRRVDPSTGRAPQEESET